MANEGNQLKKLVAIATDLELPAELRAKTIEVLGNIGTHETLLALLELAANGELSREERDLALSYSRNIIKSGR